MTFSNDARKDRTALVVLAGILAFSFALRMAFLHEPFERDEGMYAAVAQEILRGGLPYRDAIDIKPPGVHYVYAVAIALGGASVEAVRVFTAVYASVSLILVYLVSRRLFGTRAGLLSAAIHGVVSTAPQMQASSSNTEVFMVLPVLAAFHALLRYGETGRARHVLVAGALSAASLLVKTVALPQLAVLGALLLVMAPDPDGLRSRARRIPVFLGAGAGVVALACAPFLLAGAWTEFYYWNVTFILQKYRGMANAGAPLAETLSTLAPELLFPGALAAIGLARLRWDPRRPELVAAGLLVPAALVGVLLPGKNFPHYFIQLVPPMAMVGGYGLDALWTAGRRARVALGAIAASSLLVFVAVDLPFYATLSPEEVSRIKYGPVFVDAERVSGVIRERTKPGDFVFQWGFEPEIYFLTNRPSPVPYLASLLVGLDRDPDEAVARLDRGLRARPPKYIVAQLGGDRFAGEAAVVALVRERYVMDGIVAGFALFRLREAEPSGDRPAAGSSPG